MRIYSASDEETLRASRLLKDWAGEGLLSKKQYQLLEKETASDLRTTNFFLRLVLFFFALVSIGAATALFFEVFLSRSSEQTKGVFLLIFAIICCAAAEGAVSRARLYRFGIEEALAACSVGFVCAGLDALLYGAHSYSPDAIQCLVPAAGAIFSFWIWHRFGFSYGFLAAMIFGLFVPGYWTTSHTAQHLVVVSFYAAGLIGIIAVRSRHRLGYLDEAYSLAEAMLWLGIYLAINLQLSSIDLAQRWLWGGTVGSEFGRPFYWTTWVLTWCVPAAVLARGLRQKDRYVIVIGMLVATLTFVTNKPYLGWPRHTWDPMLLGIVLTGIAILTRRWLARDQGGTRHGFTAERLSGRDKYWMNAGSSALGLLSPHAITPGPQTASPAVHFEGGQSGGGGASGKF